MSTLPNCPYCGKPALLKNSRVIYKGRDYGMVWICPDYPACDAYVGCHKDTNKPLGRLANAELRRAKNAAHAAFDPLWKSREMSRRGAYRWLAEQLRIDAQNCHIGMFDVAQCRRVVEICEARA